MSDTKFIDVAEAAEALAEDGLFDMIYDLVQARKEAEKEIKEKLIEFYAKRGINRSLSERCFRKQSQCFRNMEKATKPRRSKYWRNQWSKWGDRWRGVMGGDAVKVDLSPFTLRDIKIYGRHLRFKSPRVLEPTLDESKQLLCLEDPDLGISAFAAK